MRLCEGGWQNVIVTRVYKKKVGLMFQGANPKHRYLDDVVTPFEPNAPTVRWSERYLVMKENDAWIVVCVCFCVFFLWDWVHGSHYGWQAIRSPIVRMGHSRRMLYLLHPWGWTQGSKCVPRHRQWNGRRHLLRRYFLCTYNVSEGYEAVDFRASHASSMVCRVLYASQTCEDREAEKSQWRFAEHCAKQKMLCNCPSFSCTLWKTDTFM